MEAFDPGGVPGQVSGEYSSVQVWAKTKLFCLRGFKEEILLEILEERVLHSTRRATHQFIARAAPYIGLLPPIRRTHFSHVPNKAEHVNYSEKYLKLADESLCTEENDDGSIEQHGVVQVEIINPTSPGYPSCSIEQHGVIQVEIINPTSNGYPSCMKDDVGNIQSNMGPADSRQMQEHLSHGERSSNKPVMLRSCHQEAPSLCSSKLLPGHREPMILNSSSTHVVDIPGPSEVRITGHEILDPHGVNELLVEDPEAPPTPDLQPEARFWDCEEDIMAMCLIQCPRSPPEMFEGTNSGQEEGSNLLIQQGECAGRHVEPLSQLSYMNNNNSCWGYINSKHLLHSATKLNPSGYKRRMVQKMVYLLKASALNICAATKKKQLHSQPTHIRRARLLLQRLLRLLESKRYDWQGEALREHSCAGMQAYLKSYKARLMLDQGHRVAAKIQVSSAACFLRRLACRKVYAVKKACTAKKCLSEKVNIEMSVREQAVIVLQAFTQGYLSRKSFLSRRCALSKCHSIEQFDVRTCKNNQCSSIVSAMGDVNAVSEFLDPQHLCFAMSAEPLNQVIENFEEGFTKLHRPLPCKEKAHPTRSERKVDDWNNIPIDHVDECLDTCLLHLRPLLPSFPSDLAPEPMLLDLAVNNSMTEHSKLSNITYSNGNPIDEGHQDYLDVYINSVRNETICMPDNNHAPSHSVSEAHPACLSFGTEELRPSTLHGRVHERQSKEKLEHFAEVFLLQRHIVQQQRRAQQAPPYPPQISIEPADDGKCSGSRVLADVETIPYTCSSTEASMKNIEHGNHEPSLNSTSPITDVSGCDIGLVGADVVVDVVGLLKYVDDTFVDIHSNQVGKFIGAAVKSDGFTHTSTARGQLVIPNVTAVIVTIVAMVVYTRILCQDALTWVGARSHSKDKN